MGTVVGRVSTTEHFNHFSSRPSVSKVRMNDDKKSGYQEDKYGLQHLIREQDAMITGGANDHDDNGMKEEMEDDDDEEEDDDGEEEDDDEEEDCCHIHYISQLKVELGSGEKAEYERQLRLRAVREHITVAEVVQQDI